jgi:hypothetical protein
MQGAAMPLAANAGQPDTMPRGRHDLALTTARDCPHQSQSIPQTGSGAYGRGALSRAGGVNVNVPPRAYIGPFSPKSLGVVKEYIRLSYDKLGQLLPNQLESSWLG